MELANEHAIQSITIAGNTTDFSGTGFPASGTFVATGVMRISVCLDTATTLVARLTPTGGSATNFTLFDGGSLVANAPRTCILKVPTGASLTFRAGAACVVQWMTVEMVTGGGF